MSRTPDIDKIISDIASGAQPVFCGKHFYTPSKVSNPIGDCVDCWKALYLTIWAKTPADDRANWVEGLNSAIHHLLEDSAQGKWDYQSKLDFISHEKDKI